ncbi:hypothetical protein JZ751_029516 [Albula glossodonta]|uniref:Uncharacterized protein n=1 Tax=Albula glossodonta TaxID=121402 RepID=A0A8T2NEC7_9TELE|nr:hypothetical protein JZ751_029516 [Albula glossodonta]
MRGSAGSRVASSPPPSPAQMPIHFSHCSVRLGCLPPLSARLTADPSGEDAKICVPAPPRQLP